MAAGTDRDDEQDRLWLGQVAAGGAPGDKAAHALFRKYYRRLVGAVIGKFGFEPALAEELVQEAFIRAFDAAQAFGQRSRVYTWLYRIVMNGCLDQLRRTHREDTFDDEAWLKIEADQLLAGDDDGSEAEAVQQCFDRQFALFAKDHPRHADALTQVYFNRLTARAAAAAQDRSAAAMRQFLVDSRNRLRSYLKQCRQLMEP